MEYTELIVTIILKKDIYFADSAYIIGKNINKLMLLDSDLREFHVKREYKMYVFNNFYPLEKDKLYKKDKLYIFKIRGFDCEFMKKVHNLLYIFKTDDFQVISVDGKQINRQYIKELYTITPVIITVDGKPWMQSDDLELFKNRIESNLEKKYKNFYNLDIDIKGKFIKNITFKNKLPMYFNYKNIKLLGNKVRISIQDNEEAQKLAFLSMGVGLGEKNSVLGAGFCESREI